MTYDVRLSLGSEPAAIFADASQQSGASDPPIADRDILHLAELVPILRQRLGIDGAFTDDAVVASLHSIVVRSSVRERWRAAFDSNLGHWIADQGRDLNTALNTLLALLPKPRM